MSIAERVAFEALVAQVELLSRRVEALEAIVDEPAVEPKRRGRPPKVDAHVE